MLNFFYNIRHDIKSKKETDISGFDRLKLGRSFYDAFGHTRKNEFVEGFGKKPV